MDKTDFLAKLIRENGFYFGFFVLFLLVGGIFLSVIEQGDLIFYFSDHRSDFSNLFFFYFTKLGEELVFIFAFLLLLFVKFRYALTLPLLGFSVSFTSFLSKKLFAHDRPYLFFREAGLFDQISVVDGVVLNGGANSFPSGHTMAAFALYTFLALVITRKKGTAIMLFVTALLVGISRVYLVQHFFKDIYLGAILGLLLAVLWFYLQGLVGKETGHWLDRSLRTILFKKQNPPGFE